MEEKREKETRNGRSRERENLRSVVSLHLLQTQTQSCSAHRLHKCCRAVNPSVCVCVCGVCVCVCVCVVFGCVRPSRAPGNYAPTCIYESCIMYNCFVAFL